MGLNLLLWGIVRTLLLYTPFSLYQGFMVPMQTVSGFVMKLRNKMKNLDEAFLIKFLLCLMVSMQIVSGFVMKLKPFAGP